MKQKGFSLTVALCLFSLLCYSREAVSLSTGRPVIQHKLSPVTRDVSVSADGNTVDITYRFTDVGRDSGSIPGTQIWFFEEFNQSTSVGKPSLPVSTDILHIPSGMTASVAVIDSSFIDFPSVIAPATEPSTEGGVNDDAIMHPELKYILILGSHKQIPAEYMADTKNYTDLYYSVSPSNAEIYPVPDYALGRLPAQTAEQSMTMVKKIIDYELRPPTDSAFYKTALNCAGFDCIETEKEDSILKIKYTTENQRFVKRSEEVRDHLVAQKYEVCRAYLKFYYKYNPAWYNRQYCTEIDLKMPDKILYTNHAWADSANYIINAINRGCFMQLISYHGAKDFVGISGTKCLSNEDILKLTNLNLLPVVFSMNCETGSFQYDNAFLPNLLSYDNGGAVAAFGFTNSSYTIYNDCLLAGMMDAIWPGYRIKPTQISGEQMLANPSFRLGDILIQAKAVMNSFDIRKDSLVKYSKTSLEMLHCLGDPTMEIRTAYPDNLMNDVRINRSANDILVKVNHPSRISFYNEATGEVVQCEGSGSGWRCEHPENVTVCVSRHNSIPCVDYAPVSPFIQATYIHGEFSISTDKVYMGSDVFI